MKRTPDPKSAKGGAAIIFAVIAFAIFIIACLDRDRGHGTSVAVGNSTIFGSKWPAKRYPIMVQRLGAQTFDRAALYVPQIARLVDGKKACDRVTTVEMAISSTPKSVRYRASCNNGYEDRIDVDFTRTKSA